MQWEGTDTIRTLSVLSVLSVLLVHLGVKRFFVLVLLLLLLVVVFVVPRLTTSAPLLDDLEGDIRKWIILFDQNNLYSKRYVSKFANPDHFNLNR